ncbi:MAG TPA: hypothetical protein PLA25_09725 [Anaerolineaceae bacterium]|nr:hypothetical protein [Anaerolineaceae bacterium]
MMENSRTRRSEFAITFFIKAAGYSSILLVTAIFIFLMKEGLPALGDVDLKTLFGSRWYPIEGYFGIWPLILGSLLVTVGAALVAIPLGVARQFIFLR